MFPDFQYLMEGVLKTHMPEWLGLIKTFGFFVALAFLAASWLLTVELKRKERLGLLQPELVPLPKAKRFMNAREELRIENNSAIVYPHQRVGDIIIYALLGGIVGAKIFNAFETWEDFKRDPVGNLFSGSGLTFYGGLIVAAALIFYYCKKHKIPIIHFCDAIAPALMLAYGIGRLGCHFSGDGDWGIFNSAYITSSNGRLIEASEAQYLQMLQHASSGFMDTYGALSNVPHASVHAPSWLPDWLFAINYPHNVNKEGIHISGCLGKYCNVLPVGVFPTSLYEAAICFLLFLLLWSVKEKFRCPLHLFGLYLILNGLERFLIEKIRVNYKYDWGLLHPTQAEIISTFLVLSGLSILLFYRDKNTSLLKKV
ncbi:prolipoprotein diacylglyceryl transferase [Chitinophagaceae bacterium LB-8]|uniref:Prolipoprotein diacylglyceryl transferase n=1 Tax=Paraflavisolibacter caeni TaxID=2982496 RepID=A0A9X3B878_9BACT|nr:prolipoprotein diacylglyceryl transferase family protein [Paraflavisolibacter caeni]MCU7549306.1 prolipoprotein diacylglyceryl transferase [Paraflavisolibacter caeni]